MLFNNTTYLCILYTLLLVIISIFLKKTNQLLKFLIKNVNNKPLGEYYK